MDRRERRRRVLFALAAALACAALIFPGLGASSLDGDEALYAAVVHDSAADGALLPLELRGDPYFNKPPGGFALALGARRLLGDSELALRLPSALFALAVCLWLFRTGARWFGPEAGFVAAVALASTSTALSRHAFRGATFDSLLLLLTTIAISVALESILERGERRGAVDARWLAPAVVSVGLKYLAGPAGIAGSLLFAGAAAGAAGRDRKLLRGAAIAAATAIATAVVALVLWGLVTRDEHLLSVFRHDLFRRLTGDLPRVPRRPAGYYLTRLAVDFGPLLALPLAWTLPACRERLRARRAQLAAAAGWGLAMPLLLAPFGSKLNWYVLPSYPGIALAIGAGAAALAAAGAGWRTQVLRLGVVVLLLFQAVTGFRLGRSRDRVHPLSALATAAETRPEARLFVDPVIGFQFDPDDVASRPLPTLHGIEEYWSLRRLERGRAATWPPEERPGACSIVIRSAAGQDDADMAGALRIRAWRQGPDLLWTDSCGLAAVSPKI